MTVSTTNVSVSYAGDGATTEFPITFQFGTSADLLVTLVADDTDTETAQTLTTHYTVSQSANKTGSLTMLTAPGAGYTLWIERATALTQPDSLRNQGQYYPETVEGMLDATLRKVQEVSAATNRALKVPRRSGADGQLPALTPGGVLVVNGDGSGFGIGGPVDFGSVLVDFQQLGLGAVSRPALDKLRERISLLDFVPLAQHAAIKNGTSTYDATADLLSAVTYAAGRPVELPEGLVLVNAMTYGSGWLVGAGKDKTEIRLSATGTETALVVDSLRLDMLTLSDGGRSAMDHTTNTGVYLAECVDSFIAHNVAFKTDRSVLSQVAATTDSYCEVVSCSLVRNTEALSNEAWGMNLFTGTSVKHVLFDRFTCKDIVARSVLNFTYDQLTSGVNEPAIATVRDCIFDHVGYRTAGEVKCIFLQGYLVSAGHNQFRDVFGGTVWVNGNLNSTTSAGVRFKAFIFNNKVDFTTANQAVAWAANEPPGSIYCRHGDTFVQGNHLDFTNLLVASSGYSAIKMRHGYKAVHILDNTVIGSKAEAIVADLSDLNDNDESSVYIERNTILNQTASASRWPIAIKNNSATKVFDQVVIRDNLVEHTSATSFLDIQVAPPRADSFMAKNMIVVGNFNKIGAGTYDGIHFDGFPEFLYAPNTSVTVLADPEAGLTTAGVIPSMADAFACAGKYRCRSLALGLSPLIVSTKTVAGSTSVSVLPAKLTINGDNGAGGRIRFNCADAVQSNLVMTLDGNEVEINDCIFESDTTATTSTLLRLQGRGHATINNPDAQMGESFVLSTGPDFDINGGTIDTINYGSTAQRGIVVVDADRIVRCSIKDSTGATNYRLYNFITPALFASDNIGSLTTTSASVKTFTLVT